MAIELQSLNEQLLNLKIIYEDGLLNNKPVTELNTILRQMNQLEKLIAERKLVLSRNQ